ncbi:MAG TPA: DUF4097 family beta strand repeat-containing protein [Candidatus Eisenbacteria bacterium]|nr:DUF4097 family beta strand repeat-containing protein [Candidatus Eisenbacteria bacterium]
MATPTRSSGLFSGLVLLSIGVLLLAHNYGHLDLSNFFTRWWPLLIIFWGAVKLYERTAGRRFGGGDGGRITGGEVLLVVLMLALLGSVVGWDYTTKEVDIGDNFTFDLDVAPVKAPANARVLVSNGRGDISVRGSDDSEIRVSATKGAKSWSESGASRLTKAVNVAITQNGDGFEIRPTGYDLSDPRISVSMEVAIPQKSPLTVKTNRGDVTISGMSSDLAITDGKGDVDVRDTKGNVNVEMRNGDARISDTQGDVKVSGKGGEVDVNDSTGSLTVDGDFYGPVRADKVTRGVRLVSGKTDLTLSALGGHLEAGSGNMNIVDVPGNLSLRTRDTEVNVENPGGKVNIDNRNAAVGVRFSAPPKDDVEIVNSSSEIELTLPGNANFEVTADCHNCEIDSEFSGVSATKTESGDSHLSGKIGNGKGPRITLKTSYGNISLRRISVSALPRPPAPPHVPEPPHELPPDTEQ